MDITQQYFTCKKCGVSKIWGEMVKDNRSEIKIRRKCKDCKNQEQRSAIEIKGKDAQREYYREWSAKNRGYQKKYQKQYWAKRGISSAEYQRQYWAENREKLSKGQRAWRKSNPKSRAETNKRYLGSHPEKNAEFIKRKREKEKIDRVANPEKYRGYRAKLREKLSTGYVKDRLRRNGFTLKQIEQNPELINIQRIIIQTKRLCKT